MHALKTEPYSGTNQQAILATPASRNSPATSDAALQRASELTTLRARIGLISAQTPSFLSFPCWRFIQTPVRPVNSDNPPLFILGLMWGLAAALLAAVIILLPQPPASQVGVE